MKKNNHRLCLIVRQSRLATRSSGPGGIEIFSDDTQVWGPVHGLNPRTRWKGILTQLTDKNGATGQSDGRALLPEKRQGRQGRQM